MSGRHPLDTSKIKHLSLGAVISILPKITKQSAQNINESSPSYKIANNLFFIGGSFPEVKEGINPVDAKKCFIIVMRSFELSHEEKMWLCSWMLDNWFICPPTIPMLHNSYIIKVVRKTVEPIVPFTKIENGILYTDGYEKSNPIIGFLKIESPSFNLEDLKEDVFIIDGKEVIIGWSEDFFVKQDIEEFVYDVQGKNDPVVQLFG